jgi:hypothetical protein
VSRCLHDLEIIGKASEPADVENQIIYLPL